MGRLRVNKSSIVVKKRTFNLHEPSRWHRRDETRRVGDGDHLVGVAVDDEHGYAEIGEIRPQLREIGRDCTEMREIAEIRP